MKSKISTILTLALVTSVSAARGQNVEFSNPSILIEHEDNVLSYYVSDFDYPNDPKKQNGTDYMKTAVIEFENGTSASVNGTITLNPSTRFQDIDGFGFAITYSAALNLKNMDPTARKQLLTKLFSRKTGYGCSYVRIPIGCSDFSSREYTCWDNERDGFALQSDETEYIIPIMKEILAINPTVKVLGTPWTAPRWMKNNNAWTGGNVKSEHYGTYASYFVKWIRAMEQNGINIYAVTQQNEPLNWGNSASMYMSWQEAKEFAKSLGKAFEQDGLKVKIYCYDHNYDYDENADQNHYPANIYADTEAAKYIAGAAYHNYCKNWPPDPTEMSYIHRLYPNKELLFSEWDNGMWSSGDLGVDDSDPLTRYGVYATTTDAKHLIYNVMENWGRGTIVWNLMLDEDHGPFRPGGSSTSAGAITAFKSGEIKSYNSFYYVIGIAASAVSENATRIGTTGSVSDVQCVAFDNNTDGYGVILANMSKTATRTVRVRQGDRSFVVTLAPRTIGSYRW